jgi:putative ABC transport system permease protein
VWTSVSGVLFWQAGRTGYQIVLAPEGVPTISVSYWAFVAPALLWIGAALLVWRLSDMLLGRGWTVVARALRPVAGKLSRIIAHSLSRQRVPLARAIVLLALALAFAASTATFNATYRAQAEVDAQLTNGADITVTEPPGSSVSAGAAAKLAAVPGVRAVEPIQHRFAYVGADLQVLYGVNPSSITNVTALQDNYFQGGTVEELMHTLAAQPDSLLVSAETVKDFQLRPGDAVNLRIQDARTHHLVTVEFHYIGIVTEFPTAPKDSFFVANAGYIAQRTGTDAIGAFLVDTGGHDTTAVADRIKAAVGTSAAVTDITTARGAVGSSLTAVSLAGLTRIELGFGLVLAAASGGQVLALGLAERRRSFAIADVLGATRSTAVTCAGRGRNPHHVSRRGGRPQLGAVADVGGRTHRRFRPPTNGARGALDVSRRDRRHDHRRHRHRIGRHGSPCAAVFTHGARRTVGPATRPCRNLADTAGRGRSGAKAVGDGAARRASSSTLPQR